MQVIIPCGPSFKVLHPKIFNGFHIFWCSKYSTLFNFALYLNVFIHVIGSFGCCFGDKSFRRNRSWMPRFQMANVVLANVYFSFFSCRWKIKRISTATNRTLRVDNLSQCQYQSMMPSILLVYR